MNPNDPPQAPQQPPAPMPPASPAPPAGFPAAQPPQAPGMPGMPPAQPAPGPAPQAVQPPQPGVGPVVGGPVGPQPPQPGMPMPDMGGGAPSGKARLKKILALVGGLVFIVILALVALMLFKSDTPKYSASKVKQLSTSTYQVSYPSQWEDLSGKDIKTVGDLTDSLGSNDSYKLYGYGYDAKIKKAKTIFVTLESSENALSSDELSTLTSDTAIKQEFEDQIKSGLWDELKLSDSCSSTTNQQLNFDYSDSSMPLKVVVSADCTPKDKNDASLYKELHLQMIIGFSPGHEYGLVLATSKDDWTKNETFYNSTLFGSFKPL